MKQKFLKKLMMLVGLPLAGVNYSYAATVDFLVLYDSFSANYFNQQVGTAMQNWVAQTNNMYKDSNIDIQLRLVGVVANEQSGSDMDAVLEGVRVNSTAVNLRNQYGADFVTQLHKTGECGIGYMAVSAGYAWNVVGPDCGPLAMAHELGHNMGLNHSRKQGDTGGARYAYALGHGVDGLFGTVMTYSWLFVNKASGRVAKFSNPDVNCLGAPCGVPVGQSTQAHAALALNNVKNEIAAFRSATIPVSSQSSSSSSNRSSSSVISSSRPSSVSSSSRSSSSLSSRSSSVATTSKCTYVVTNNWGSGFTGAIRITNTGSSAVNGWSVSWAYSGSTRVSAAWNSNLSGSNPYSATALGWNSTIQPGQTVEFGLQGSHSGTAEIPAVTGSVCN